MGIPFAYIRRIGKYFLIQKRFFFAAFLVVYLSICTYFYVFQGQLLFHPHLVPKAHPDILAPFAFDWMHDGINHHGWYVHGAQKKPLIVYLGGNAEDVSQSLIKYYKKFQKNYDILTLEYRGFGSSEGVPSEKKLVGDTIALIQHWMAHYAYKAEDIVIIGRSLGSGVTVQVAQHIQPRGIVLVTPFDSVNTLANLKYPYVPIALLNKNAFQSDVCAPQLNIPGLFIIAGNDTVTPPANGLRLADLMGRSPWIATINSATHTNIYNYSETWYDIQLFLKALFHTGAMHSLQYLSQAHFHIGSLGQEQDM